MQTRGQSYDRTRSHVMPRGGARPPTKGVAILQPLDDRTLDALFKQSIVGSYRGEPYLDGLRRLARLIEAELQGQIYQAAHRQQWPSRRAEAEPEGQLARRERYPSCGHLSAQDRAKHG